MVHIVWDIAEAQKDEKCDMLNRTIWWGESVSPSGGRENVKRAGWRWQM